MPATSSCALPEASLSESFLQLALPYFDSVPVRTLTTHDGILFRYRVFQNTQAVEIGKLVFILGRAKFIRKYVELIYDLRNSGDTVYLYDHRAQGESPRILEDDSHKGDVRHFQEYADDLSQFMAEVVLPRPNEKIYFLAHWMGATIATVYLLQNPYIVTAMTAVSPMYEPNLGQYSLAAAYAYAKALILFGKGGDDAPDKNRDQWNEPFPVNAVTTSKARFDYALQELMKNDSLIVGWATVQWVLEAIEASIWLLISMSRLSAPV